MVASVQSAFCHKTDLCLPVQYDRNSMQGEFRNESIIGETAICRMGIISHRLPFQAIKFRNLIICNVTMKEKPAAASCQNQCESKSTSWLVCNRLFVRDNNRMAIMAKIMPHGESKHSASRPFPARSTTSHNFYMRQTNSNYPSSCVGHWQMYECVGTLVAGWHMPVITTMDEIVRSGPSSSALFINISRMPAIENNGPAISWQF